MTSRRLGLYGGTFNPVHLGHLHVARAARDRFDLDEVWLIPSRQPPHRSSEGLASADDRLTMVELAVRGEERLRASDIEIRREGPSYTVDTLRAVAARRPSWERFFIIGSDSIPELPSWRCAEEIVTSCRFITVLRRGHPVEGLERLQEEFGAEVAERFREGFLELDPVPISSTEIRARLARGDSIDGLVPIAVEAHIRRRGLYVGRGRPA